jgi:ABC-type multidrug transport system fused ATPase/permease subunit
MKFAAIIKRFKKGIIILSSLVVIENLAWIIEPTVFGNVIDALVDKVSSKSNTFESWHITAILLWITIYFINTGAGSIRRLVDQKIFFKIYASVAQEIAAVGKKLNFSSAKLAGLSQLSEEYVVFFQYRMPEIVDQTFGIVGAVIALFMFDWRISVTCLSIILPLVLIARIYIKRVLSLQSDYHDVYENTFEVFSSLKTEQIKDYYLRTANSKQKIGRWSALNFGILRISLLLIFLAVLYISIDLDDFSTGNIYSVVSYIWTFINSAEYIPDLMESITSLKDISQRIKFENV